MLNAKHANARYPRLLFRPRIVLMVALIVLVVPPVSFLSGFGIGMAVFGNVENSEEDAVVEGVRDVVVVEIDDAENIVDSWSLHGMPLQDSVTGEIVFEADGEEVRISKDHALILGADALDESDR